MFYVTTQCTLAGDTCHHQKGTDTLAAPTRRSRAACGKHAPNKKHERHNRSNSRRVIAEALTSSSIVSWISTDLIRRIFAPAQCSRSTHRSTANASSSSTLTFTHSNLLILNKKNYNLNVYTPSKHKQLSISQSGVLAIRPAAPAIHSSLLALLLATARGLSGVGQGACGLFFLASTSEHLRSKRTAIYSTTDQKQRPKRYVTSIIRSHPRMSSETYLPPCRTFDYSWSIGLELWRRCVCRSVIVTATDSLCCRSMVLYVVQGR